MIANALGQRKGAGRAEDQDGSYADESDDQRMHSSNKGAGNALSGAGDDYSSSDSEIRSDLSVGGSITS